MRDDDDSVDADRRRFLAHLSGAVFLSGVALLEKQQPAFAAADEKMTMQAPKNRKIGGLALKLRAVTNVMVREICCW